ncbi:hypothetical protein DFJ43DRAFT_1171257 [Lentinula guzmanii]|uniref:Uncharacterized protein n=1 Tax=Lentinula guzmanii TaxID=2804957 RepID=A0AA38JQE1_9AGAR|nr:hypothetical protein DFJ43DRAFT_1171257 [Lentinula guzmanii]
MDQRGESRPSSKNEVRRATLQKTQHSATREPALSTGGGGVFSGVLNYVTAEVGNFITNATGGVITVNSGVPSSRVKHARHDLEMRRRKKKRTRDWTNSVERESTLDRPLSSSEISSRQSVSTPHDEETSIQKREPTRHLKTTMPGSLFPRSPSLMPSEAGHRHENGVEEDEGRHVSWNFGLDDENQPGSSTVYVPSMQPSPQSPFRPPLVPSVKDAVAKFYAGPDIDPSLLLPSPPRRKGKSREFVDVDFDDDSWLMPPPRNPGRGPSDGDTTREIRVKGKERELSEAIEEHKRKEARWERDRDKEAVAGEDDFMREKKRDKERIRNLEEEIERLKEELRKRPAVISTFPPPPPPPPPPPLAVSIAAPSALNISDATAPFAHVRAALKHAPTPKEAPINPPRRGGQPTVGVTADKMAAFLNEMKTVRLRKVGSQSSLGKSTSDTSRRETSGNGNDDSFFDTERSRLSISDLRTTKEILGGPPAGSSSAPARELSWPSTRSVSSNGEGNASASSTRKRKRMESMDNAENIDHSRDSDLSSQIRKSIPPWIVSIRIDTFAEKLRESIKHKRRILNKSINSTSLSESRYPYRPLPPPSSVPSQSQNSTGAASEPASSSVLPHGTNTSRVWGSISTDSSSSSIAYRDADKATASAPSLSSVPAETPSLCSDNDAEHPRHVVDSSTPPSTPPPGTSARFITPPTYVAEVIDLEVDLVDKDDEREDGPSVAAGTHWKQSRRRSSPHPSAYLAKRIPASPLPNPSPKRPKPPATSKRGTSAGRIALHPRPPTPLRSNSDNQRDEDDEEDPLSLRSKKDEAIVASTSSGQPHHRRRRSTLDEELRAANKASFIAETEGEYSEDELGNALFIGTGTRSKKLGFLAHGGAGGPPVWMGEGYVLGTGYAEEEGEEEEEEEEEERTKDQSFNTPRERKLGPPTVSRTRIPVPKSKPPMVMRRR